MSQQINAKWKHRGKIATIVVGIIVIILILIQLFFTVFIESYLKTNIEDALSSPKKNLTAHVNNLELSTLRRQISIQGLSLRHNTKAQQDSSQNSSSPIDSLKIQDVTINGIHIFAYLFDNKLVLNNFIIQKPSGHFTQLKPASKNTAEKSNKSTKQAIYDGIKSNVSSIHIDHFAIKDFQGKLRRRQHDSDFAEIHDFTFQSSNITLDSAWAAQKSLLPTQIFSADANSIAININPRLYKMHLGKLRFSSSDSSLQIMDMKLIPKLPKYKFSQTVGHQIDRMKLSFNKIKLSGADFPAMINKKAFNASSLSFSDGNLDIFHSKKLPRGPKNRKKLYNVAFRDMKTPVMLDSVVISNLDIRYTEHKKDVPQPGYVTFENTNAKITDLDNTSESTIRMHAQSDIMGRGHLNAHFTFPPNKYGTHYVKASLSRMPVDALNPTLKNLAKIKVKSGVIHSLDFSMEMGPQKSNGKVKLNYSDLKLSMIKFKDGNETNKKTIKSFLANTFVVKDKNKPPLRTGDISFERIQSKSIFNYWWKSLLSGLKGSVGL